MSGLEEPLQQKHLGTLGEEGNHAKAPQIDSFILTMRQSATRGLSRTKKRIITRCRGLLQLVVLSLSVRVAPNPLSSRWFPGSSCSQLIKHNENYLQQTTQSSPGAPARSGEALTANHDTFCRRERDVLLLPFFRRGNKIYNYRI